MNPERINIKDLTVEEPEKEEGPVFDVERDITENDWRGMINYLKKADEGTETSRLLGKVKVIDSTKDIGLDARQVENIINHVLETVEDYKAKNDWERAFHRAAYIKLLDSNVKFEVTSDGWEAMNYLLDESRKGTLGWFSFRALEMKIIDPNIDLKIDSDTLENMMNLLEKWRKENDWTNFCGLAARMKIICPGATSLDRNDWEGMKRSLVDYRDKKSWSLFIEQAANMKMLAAEKVEVTERGLEVIMHEDKVLESETPIVPEQRKF